jgi:hypothetical protein
VAVKKEEAHPSAAITQWPSECGSRPAPPPSITGINTRQHECGNMILTPLSGECAVDDDEMPEGLRPYLRHPVVHAQAAARDGLLAKRRAPPARRGPNGRWETGCSGNPNGRPKGRTTVRKAFHQFGLAAVAKMAELADDPSLSPGQRAAVLSQCVQLSYSVRGIRSDARAWRKAEQLRREREMDEALMDFVRRLGLLPRAKLMASQAAQPSLEPRERPARPALPEAPGGEPKALPSSSPPAPPVPAPRNEARPPTAAQPEPEPCERPAAAPPLPAAPGAEAKALSDGEAQAPADDGNSGPGQAPQRPFRITLPF